MKRSLLFTIILFALGIGLIYKKYQQQTFSKKYKVCINQFVNHPALDATVQGIVDGLLDSDVDIKTESAQASPVLAAQLSSKFIGEAADVIVAVATISAQSVAKFAKEKQTKLIFSSVTDPIKAGLVNSLSEPGNNTSGVSNFIELLPQLELIKRIQPGLTKLGFLYNPGEINSITLIDKMQPLCKELNIELVLQVATKSSEVAQATILLVSKVDAIFISNDSTALSSLSSIINLATNEKVPVYVSDTDAVVLGALAALGPNQYQVGLQTAEMVKQALQGKDINKMAVEFPLKTELYLNVDAAKKVGIIFDEELYKSASQIITKE